MQSSAPNINRKVLSNVSKLLFMLFFTSGDVTHLISDVSGDIIKLSICKCYMLYVNGICISKYYM